MKSVTATDFIPYLGVHASAGSGKTHQLVNRLITLLLNGAEPGGILAITFTRKAAAEMTQRLLQRVQTLSTSSDAALEKQLSELGLSITPDLRQRVAGLYEKLLYTPYPVRSTTFHAFCQDLLRRFPMEAEVPPGFELVEITQQLQDEAWERFTSELTQHNNSDTATAMDTLLHKLGLQRSRRVLFNFLNHRSDWWALTQDCDKPVEVVYAQLHQHLDVDIEANPVSEFLSNAEILQQLQEFHGLLLKHPNKNNDQAAQHIELGLNTETREDTRLKHLWSAFYTKDTEPYSRKISKTLITKLGQAGSERFVGLHESLCEQLATLARQQHAIDTLTINHAWLSCGEALLSHYQGLKQLQRVLDFADLEWSCYLLLNTASHADWVQYKLDQRIDHLLIDEFQDTNPIQWQLILPLLQELAAGESERQRSVMFVGDSKQSIYSFRRAEPRLFDAASTWLLDHLAGAQQQSLSKSWRSSLAIMECVNKIFSQNPDLQLNHFAQHDTEYKDLHGRVNLLPLAKKQAKAPSMSMRNPLTTPREQTEAAQYHEAQQIAQIINELIQRPTLIGKGEKCRLLRYADIMILFRSRTAASDFERALREAQIPYFGTERGTLLDSLEVRDMINLLQWLITPFNNLALVGILRSPLFAASDEDLMCLAGKSDWFAALLKLATELPEQHPFSRAARYLQSWMPLADQLPVHDLLDHIYSETDIFSRYRAAFPEHLHPRVVANLTRFLELALENDSGRYPSLTRFMVWLEQLRQQDKEAPDQPPGQGELDRVRLLTVHEAKGLEAPIVFVADSSRESPAKHAPQLLVEWPASSSCPQHFVLSPAGKFPNDYCSTIMTQLRQKSHQEDANLLYVALTRAEQYLYISASDKPKGWYAHICRAYGIDAEKLDNPICLVETGTLATHTLEPVHTHIETITVDPRLQSTIKLHETFSEIAPSKRIDWQASSQPESGDTARERGLIIHALLEALALDPDLTVDSMQQRFCTVAPTHFNEYWQEAQSVIQQFPRLFDPQQYIKAYVEVPVAYREGDRTVYGVIDRLVCYADRLLIVDYKTHRLDVGTTLQAAAEPYREQLRLYAKGVQQLYPEQPISSWILFTTIPQYLELPA